MTVARSGRRRAPLPPTPQVCGVPLFPRTVGKERHFHPLPPAPSSLPSTPVPPDDTKAFKIPLRLCVQTITGSLHSGMGVDQYGNPYVKGAAARTRFPPDLVKMLKGSLESIKEGFEGHGVS